MKITTNDYSIKYDTETATISWQGFMRLNGKEYDPILQLLNQVIDLEPPIITLNLQGLEALNSSGISMLGRFVFSLAKKKKIQLIVQGDKKIIWQRKWVINFQRLMPSLLLEWK